MTSVGNMSDGHIGRTVEQRMASYRQRIRTKLRERGCPEHDLERRTEELMRRGPFRFDMADVASIVDQ